MVPGTGYLYTYTSVFSKYQGWDRKPTYEEFEHDRLFCYVDHMEYFLEL